MQIASRKSNRPPRGRTVGRWEIKKPRRKQIWIAPRSRSTEQLTRWRNQAQSSAMMWARWIFSTVREKGRFGLRKEWSRTRRQGGGGDAAGKAVRRSTQQHHYKEEAWQVFAAPWPEMRVEMWMVRSQAWAIASKDQTEMVDKRRMRSSSIDGIRGPDADLRSNSEQGDAGSYE